MYDGDYSNKKTRTIFIVFKFSVKVNQSLITKENFRTGTSSKFLIRKLCVDVKVFAMFTQLYLIDWALMNITRYFFINLD